MTLSEVLLERAKANIAWDDKKFWHKISISSRAGTANAIKNWVGVKLRAKGFDASVNGLRSYSEVHTEEKEPPSHQYKETRVFGEGGTETLITESTRLKSIEDVIAYHEIDTTKYIVTPIESTFWEVGMKGPDGKPLTMPLHRLKCKISPRPKQSFLMADALEWILTRPPYVPQKSKGNGATGVLMISDIHFGASIEGFLLTKTFNSSTLISDVGKMVERTNDMRFSKVEVVIGGDLIESFTGVSHPSTWKGMDKMQVGANAVKGVVALLHEHLLSNIRNLGQVHVVGGNHGRGTVKMDGDDEAWAEDLACEMLRMRGYKINFDPILLNPEIDGIKYIISHGHFGITKKTTPDIVNKYGSKDLFNILVSGHVHNGQKKQGYSFLTERVQDVDLLMVEAHNHLKLILRPLFTGGRYEATNGWHSQSGGMIVWNSGNGKPTMLDVIL